MKTADVFIYICLVTFGFIFGWFFKGVFTQPEEAPKDQEVVISKIIKPENDVITPVKNEVLSESSNQEKPIKSEIEKIEVKKNLSSSENKENSSSNLQNKEEVNVKIERQLAQEIVTIQKLLSKNDFLSAIKFLASKNKDEESSIFNEATELLSIYVQNKVKQKESLNVLADIEKALGLYPGWWTLIVLKSKVYAALGEYEEGAKNLRSEMFYIKNEKDLNELTSLIRSFRTKRIEQLKQQKLNERLIAYYEELILEDPGFAQYYFELGKLYADKNDFYSAIVMLKMIVADETYGRDAAELISQIIAFQELEAAKQIVKLENKNAIEIPIVRVNDRIFVYVHLNEKIEAKFLIDTGATISIISFNMANKLGFTSNQLKDLRWFQTAGGMVKQPVVRLSTLTIANVKMNEMMVAVSKETGNDIDGLLGMNFLGRFNFEINYEKNLLILKQK